MTADKSNKIFLTTTLPYANSKPHIGHAFEFILGDAISRFLKSRFKTETAKVHFNIGLDEHGEKIYKRATELGITPKQHIANLTETWLDFCRTFHIEYDSFYKTSDAEHHRKVKIIWNLFKESGNIYKGSYSGNYCIGCESYKSDKDLTADGKCPDHPTITITQEEEECYKFRLTNYKHELLTWLDKSPNFLQPKNKTTELRNLIEDAVDIPISRPKRRCPWGIAVPDDEDHVIYVWFDALLNYIFAAGYLSPKPFHWDYVIQICGSDNLRFQAIIFQAFLEAEGLRHTDRLLVHGTIVDAAGHKMSKSEGNTIDPIEQVNKQGLDAVRYYALACLNTYGDSAWNEDDLVKKFNAEICNEYGNLISRVLHLIDIKEIPLEDYDESGWSYVYDDDLFSIIQDHYSDALDLWREFKIKEALHKTNELVKLGNKYFNDKQPYNAACEDYIAVLSTLYHLLHTVSDLYAPVFPNRIEEIKEALSNKKKVILFNKLENKN